MVGPGGSRQVRLTEPARRFEFESVNYTKSRTKSEKENKLMTFRMKFTILFVAALGGLQGLQAADVEVFGGYSVTRMKPESGANSATMNGWNSSVTAYPWTRIGFTADFAGYYGSATGDYTVADGSAVHAHNSDIR